MKKTKDILIVLVLGILLVILVWVGIVAITRLNKDASAKVGADQSGQISLLSVKIDSLEKKIMHGQQSKDTSAQVDVNQREQISQLSTENEDLKRQLDFMEKRIGYGEKFVDDLKGNITFWFCFVTIVVTIIAIAVPLFNMSEIKEKQKEVEEKQKEVEETQKDVEEKQKDVEEKQKDFEEKQKKLEGKLKSSEASYDKVNEQIDSIKTNLSRLEDDSNKLVNQMSIDSAALTLYMLADARNINDPLFYYDLIIDTLKEFRGIHSVYNKRGQLRFDNGDYKKAVEDFEMAIEKKDDEPDYYSSCAKCYRKLAENEQDPTERTKYEAKAREYEERAEELKQKGK